MSESAEGPALMRENPKVLRNKWFDYACPEWFANAHHRRGWKAFPVRQRRMTSGFTLLEILATLIIFTGGVMAVFDLLSTALAASVDAENTIIAVYLSQQRLEEMRSLDFDTGIVNETRAGVPGFVGFEREVTVATAQPDLKQVTVTTYWAFKAGEVGVPLETYISRN